MRGRLEGAKTAVQSLDYGATGNLKKGDPEQEGS
jgi:hypothetical protein